jgi:acid phosphatase
MIRTTQRVSLIAAVGLLSLTGCYLKRNPPNDLIPPRPAPESLPSLPEGPSLQVLILGDWGTGDEGQQAVARAIAETHGESPPDFVMTVGDNFYPDGVSGPGDPIWETHFEDVYQGAFWADLVFYAALGNHDHYGRPEGQLDYAKISPRWEMPDRYYAFERSMPGGGSVQFVVLDTTPIAERERSSGAQREWADSVLRHASADWVVVTGHHPVASGGWHNPQGAVRGALFPVFDAGADLYAAGHNHSTELLRTRVETLQAVCGGGAGLDNARRVERIPEALAAFTNGGWCYLRFWPDAMAVDLLDREGGLQFRHLVRK